MSADALRVTRLGCVALALLSAALVTGCTTRTRYGDCIGINGEEETHLRYEYSARNITLAIIFVELIYPPVTVVLDSLKCPVGYRAPSPVGRAR